MLMAEHQLFLPGMQPRPQWYFNGMCCGTLAHRGNEQFLGTPLVERQGDLCDNRASLLALYFRMGSYDATDIRENKLPRKLLGRDCPFDDSDKVYACNQEHLETLVLHVQEHWSDADPLPEIIVDAHGRILKELQVDLARRALGRTLAADFSAAKNYSGGRESLEVLWARESWRFIDKSSAKKYRAYAAPWLR